MTKSCCCVVNVQQTNFIYLSCIPFYSLSLDTPILKKVVARMPPPCINAPFVAPSTTCVGVIPISCFVYQLKKRISTKSCWDSRNTKQLIYKMFKFAFNVDVDNDNPFSRKNNEKELNLIPTTSLNELNEEPEEWYEAENVPISIETLENLDVYKLNARILDIGDFPIRHIMTKFLLAHITCNSEDNKGISKAEQKHSDLIPGIYEGGAKIWECTEDLLQYLAKTFKPQMLCGKRVLDLGCGAGLLGIYAYKCGSIVHFQDYNKDVLTQITIPNVLLNVARVKSAADKSNISNPEQIQPNDIDALSKNLQFYSGDWRKYSDLTSQSAESTTDKFDFILTSETIYSPKNQQKLLDTLYEKLNADGVVLVAAKTYYFGVGGGLRQFEDLITADKRFQSKVVWTSTDGVGREILELRVNEQ